MANVLGDNTVIVSAEGVLFTRPVCIKTVRFHRNAYNDAMIFTKWDENATPDHNLIGAASTWSTLTLTMTGLLPAGSPAVNDICRIYDTNTGNNQFVFQCATAGDNNDAIFDALNAWYGTVTDEASKVYSMKIWTPSVAFELSAGLDVDAEQVTDKIDFGSQGHWFPNLAVHTISTSLTAELFLR